MSERESWCLCVIMVFREKNHTLGFLCGGVKERGRVSVPKYKK